MAARGRGRGAFRGRGRGNPGAPIAKDDDGNIVSSQVEGPPPLFPEAKSVPRPAISPRDKRLLARHRSLNKFYKNSPYHLKRSSEKTGAGGVPDRIDQLAGLSKKRKEEQPLKLSDVMILHPKYFPAELLGKKRTSASSGTKQEQFWAAQQNAKEEDGKDLESRVAEYAKKEAAADARAGKDGAPGSQNANNEENEEKRANAEEEAFEEDDEDGYGHEDDDYLAGQEFQDDEEYGDEEAGGDEAYF